MEATKDPRDRMDEKFDKGSAEDISLEEIVHQLKTLERNGKPAFVYGAWSNKEKQILAKRHILNNYEVDEKIAEGVADEAVSLAVIDLMVDDVIDKSHRIQGNFKDNLEYYREFVGLYQEVSTETDREDSGGYVEPPGNSWSCDCGRLNEEDRTVRGNCGESIEDVDAEIHDDEA